MIRYVQGGVQLCTVRECRRTTTTQTLAALQLVVLSGSPCQCPGLQPSRSCFAMELSLPSGVPLLSGALHQWRELESESPGPGP